VGQHKEKKDCRAEKRTPNFHSFSCAACASSFGDLSAASALPIIEVYDFSSVKPLSSARRLLDHRKKFVVNRRRFILLTPAHCKSMPPSAAKADRLCRGLKNQLKSSGGS